MILLSCQQNQCHPEFKKSLTYLKASTNPGDKKPRLVIEIQRNIEVLESISGILNKDRGMNYLSVMTVTKGDILNWENWYSENCPK